MDPFLDFTAPTSEKEVAEAGEGAYAPRDVRLASRDGLLPRLPLALGEVGPMFRIMRLPHMAGCAALHRRFGHELLREKKPGTFTLALCPPCARATARLDPPASGGDGGLEGGQ